MHIDFSFPTHFGSLVLQHY